ncbi:PQQ-binding-like beta-propeller repeat protein [Streptomyces mirabilis]|uniref:outer membrane protein assembly factor BamB family protein n=1 Tax=Streptomyces mirabilis TaxID=68239 RepID=UPI0033F3011E
MHGSGRPTSTRGRIQTVCGSVGSAPAVADGIVFLSSSDGRVYALDAINGTERWTYRADAYQTSSDAATGAGPAT